MWTTVLNSNPSFKSEIYQNYLRNIYRYFPNLENSLIQWKDHRTLITNIILHYSYRFTIYEEASCIPRNVHTHWMSQYDTDFPNVGQPIFRIWILAYRLLKYLPVLHLYNCHKLLSSLDYCSQSPRLIRWEKKKEKNRQSAQLHHLNLWVPLLELSL